MNKFLKGMLSTVLTLAIATGGAVAGYVVSDNIKTANQETTNAEYENEIDSLSDSLASTQLSLAEKEAEVEQLKSEISDLEAQISQKEAEIKQLEAEADSDTIAELQAEIDQLTSDKNDLQTQLDETQAEIDELNDTLFSMQEFTSEYFKWDKSSYPSCDFQRYGNYALISSSSWSTDEDHLGVFVFDFDTYTITHVCDTYCGYFYFINDEYFILAKGYKVYFSDYSYDHLSFDFSDSDFYTLSATSTTVIVSTLSGADKNIYLVLNTGELYSYESDYQYWIVTELTRYDEETSSTTIHIFFRSDETEGLLYVNTTDLEFVELTSTGSGWYINEYGDDYCLFLNSDMGAFRFYYATHEFVEQ